MADQYIVTALIIAIVIMAAVAFGMMYAFAGAVLIGLVDIGIMIGELL